MLIGWLAWQERRINSRMTRDEHERICAAKHQEITEALGRIEKAVSEESTRATVYRHDASKGREKMVSDIHRIDKRLAVLRQAVASSRAGIPQLATVDDDETGERSIGS